MLRKSPLIPKRQGKKINYETWNQHTSEEHKWELYDGMPFSPDDSSERDRLAICLVYNMGLEYFAELLPPTSRKDLLQILQSHENL
ncbi:hypothetical protein [Priestia flexa]|uniref:hypothetical protein n=1 Tax=Priestia flexa TaxID=86664 RepID=UPI001CD20747|nr:hypothetical protein [Priestia flexa]MCA1202398.1 hypothetical protein [Priestia flexa]